MSVDTAIAPSFKYRNYGAITTEAAMQNILNDMVKSKETVEVGIVMASGRYAYVAYRYASGTNYGGIIMFGCFDLTLHQGALNNGTFTSKTR